MAVILLMFCKLLFVWMKLLSFCLKSVKEKRLLFLLEETLNLGQLLRMVL